MELFILDKSQLDHFAEVEKGAGILLVSLVTMEGGKTCNCHN